MKSLEQLKQAVERLTITPHTKDKVIVDRYTLITFLETCQLVLASGGVVEDKTSCMVCSDIVEDCSCGNKAWNACNEANRIARVKWLSERLEGLQSIIENYPPKPDEDGSRLCQAIRQHFERGE